MTRHSTALDFTGTESRTKQSFKEECDINNIMAKWMRDGSCDHFSKNPPTYGDFESVDDYQTACNKVMAAQASFDAMPARVRDRMDNDPAKFMEYMNDPSNAEEALSWGLYIARPGEPPENPNAAPEPTSGTQKSNPDPSKAG